VTEIAPAKVNLVLRVGPPREDGMHALASLFASVGLADELTIEEADRDEVICPGVEGENLAARALAAFRAAGGDPPPLRVTIDKRIPVAAGLGGGSADAAAVLRAAERLSPIGEAALRDVAAGLGSDVPSQLRPGHAIVTGTGERVEPVGLPAMAMVLVPASEGLSTAAVYAELDRLRVEAPAPDAGGLGRLAAGSVHQVAAALENDLEAAAVSLRPELSDVLGELRGMGALGARITGSGPTAFGVYPDRPSAEAAASTLTGALVTEVRP
jgi:4-diphosphocytidyl-2-C-methyl-D-erythritol kinase